MTTLHLNDLFDTKDTWRSAWRFLAVGALGTIIDLALFTVLHLTLDVPTLAANTLSYSAGIINNYVLHRRWTYARRKSKAVSVQFPQFATVSLSALLLSNMLVLALGIPFRALFDPRYGDLFGKLCATAICVGWNFVMNNFWTFATVTEPSDDRLT